MKHRNVFGFFCQFWSLFQIFFIGKTAIISWETPTERPFRAMLSVFNISIHEVYQKYDKNDIKTIKIGTIFAFLSCSMSI